MKTVEIRNVGIISGSLHSSSVRTDVYSGGLVGRAVGSLTIVNSYFSGSGGISTSDVAKTFLGGLVGASSGSLMIVNSYFSGSGGISSASIGGVSSGGLVGESDRFFMIVNSYFSGSGGISSASATDTLARVYSGGLVGSSISTSSSNSDSLMIVNSYSSGSGKISSVSAGTFFFRWSGRFFFFCFCCSYFDNHKRLLEH